MSNVNWKPFVFGGLASVTAECGTFPIDLTKTRLQVQGQVGDSKYREIRYRGMLHAIGRICREEGISALYSGLAPAMLRQASYGTIKIGTYQSFKRLLVDRPEDPYAGSGQCNPGKHGGKLHQHLPTGGSQGVVEAQRAAIVVGVELPAYDLAKKHLILDCHMGDNIYTHFLSSFACGLAGALASNPIDVVRTRMMNQTYGATSRSEGFMALYKGFFPNWLRLGPWNIIFFVTYEQLKKMEV
ncbi:unnamed protein product [Coregonus sp. 'balchen']|nr:unnamed protein product [Coregonus sp. 'balchen']